MSTLQNDSKSRVLELFFSVHVSPSAIRRTRSNEGNEIIASSVLSPLCKLLLQFLSLSKTWNKRAMDSLQELWRNENRGQAMYIAKDFVHRKLLGSQTAVRILFKRSFSYSDVFGVTGVLSISITDRAPRSDAEIKMKILVYSGYAVRKSRH